MICLFSPSLNEERRADILIIPHRCDDIIIIPTTAYVGHRLTWLFTKKFHANSPKCNRSTNLHFTLVRGGTNLRYLPEMALFGLT